MAEPHFEFRFPTLSIGCFLLIPPASLFIQKYSQPDNHNVLAQLVMSWLKRYHRGKRKCICKNSLFLLVPPTNNTRNSSYIQILYIHKQEICLYKPITKVRNDNSYWTRPFSKCCSWSIFTSPYALPVHVYVHFFNWCIFEIIA